MRAPVTLVKRKAMDRWSILGVKDEEATKVVGLSSGKVLQNLTDNLVLSHSD